MVFSAIQAGKADFAEFAFAAFCKRKAISLYRKKKARFEGAQKRAEFAKDPEDEDGGVDPLDTIETDEPTPEVRALAAVALGKLPEPLRSVFIQYHQFNFNQEKLAEKHGVDVRTIRNWLKKASTMLGAAGEDK